MHAYVCVRAGTHRVHADPSHPDLSQPLAFYLTTHVSRVPYLNGILFLWNSEVLSGCYVYRG